MVNAAAAEAVPEIREASKHTTLSKGRRTLFPNLATKRLVKLIALMTEAQREKPRGAVPIRTHPLRLPLFIAP